MDDEGRSGRAAPHALRDGAGTFISDKFTVSTEAGMNGQTPQDKTSEAPDGRQPWQPLDFEKIAASDAESASGSGVPDGTIYS